MLPFHSILHPTDFSPQACHAFRLACALARESGARLTIVHVRQPAVTLYGEAGMIPPDFVNDREWLQEKLARLEPADATFPFEHRLLEGDTVLEILRLAEASSCDLIVVGTHGRGGLGRLLLGSVAEALVRRATCPVLTVKTPAKAVVGNEPFESEMAHA